GHHPVGLAGAGHEAEAVDELALGGEDVATAQAVHDRLRPQLVRPVAHQRVVALVLAGEEVLRGAAVIPAHAAAGGAVRAGAGAHRGVAARAEPRVPRAGDDPAVDARAAEGGAADRVDDAAVGEGVAGDLVLAAVGGGAVAGLRLHAERDPRRGVVEVAQVL